MRRHSEELIIPALQEAVKVTVNGKIDGMRQELNNHIAKVEPILIGYETIQNGRRFLMWAATFISVVGGAILILKQFVHKL